MSTTIQAKDLTKEYPRSPYAELNGIPWLPRLVDKVRALQAGKIGAYTPFPCGGDKNFLGTFGIDADALKAVIDGGASDEAIGAWAKDNAANFNDATVTGYKQGALEPSSGEYAGWLKEAVDQLKAERPDVDFSKADNFSRMICLEEGHPLP